MTVVGDRARTVRDAGMSMVEVMVAISLLALLGTALTAVAVLGMRVSAGLQNHLNNSTAGSIATDASTKVLRTAVLPEQLVEQSCSGCTDTAIIQATRTQVSFYANLNNRGDGPSLITLQVVRDPNTAQASGQLVQTLQPPTVLGPGQYTFCNPALAGCKTYKRVLSRGLDWPAQNIFAYYNNDGDLLTSSALTASDLGSVTSIEVLFKVQGVKGRSDYPGSVSATRVRLPNADINVLAQNIS